MRKDPNEKKEFKIAINCSIALLDKDYERLLKLVKKVEDTETYKQNYKKLKPVKPIIKSLSQVAILSSVTPDVTEETENLAISKKTTA